MKHVPRRIFGLTALYLCIILGIFALQFTSGGSFSYTLGKLRVSGTGVQGGDGSIVPVLPLHVSANGVDFFLDDQNPLVVWTPAGKQHSLEATAIKRDDDSFTVFFADSVSLSFASETRGDVDIISVSASLTQKYQKAALPYKIIRSAKLEKNDSQILVASGQHRYYFPGFPIDAIDRAEIRRLNLTRASPVALYKTWIPVRGLVIEELAGIPSASEAAYRKALERFAAGSLSSFRDSITAGKLTEPLVASYIAEMGRTGMYAAGLESVPESYRSGRARTWQTNTFFNNLEKTTAGMLIKEREDRSLLSRKISEGDLGCFEFPSLVPYLVDRGSSVLLTDLSRLAVALDVSRLTPRQAAGILEVSMDYSVYASSAENPFSPLVDACERILKDALVRVDDQLYVSRDGTEIDTLLSIQTANILIRYGASFSSRSAWASVGRLLATSLLAFGGDRAVLPAKFALVAGEGNGEKSGIVAKAEQLLDPAEVYPAVMSGNSWYPHALSLSSSLGPGVWAWTSAQSVKAETRIDGSISFTVRFPQGDTHYMVVRGVKPFNRIQIYGMDFRTDPRFESYNSSGYRYNEETSTLYLKMRHKAEIEEVVIWPGAVLKEAPVESASPENPSPVPIPEVEALPAAPAQ